MTVCCICGTNAYSSKYKGVEAYRLLQCGRCGLVYIKDKPDPKEFMHDARAGLNVKSRKVEYWSFPEMYEKYKPVFLNYFAERLKRCSKYNNNIQNMFDIGSGYGFWMDFCRRKGIKVKGIDISEEAVSYARDILKLDVNRCSLKDYPFSEQSDLYNLCDVLEHLEDPNDELRVLYNLMKPSSLLYIQVPDVLGIRIPYNHNLGLPHHIWQFNFSTINKILNKNGFKVLGRWHGVQGIIGCYEKNEVTLFRKISWFIAGHFNLGNRLMVLCRKH